MTAYREPEEEKPARSYVLPSKDLTVVIFLDSICRMQIFPSTKEKWCLRYHFSDGKCEDFVYPSEEEVRKELKVVADSKTKWDEHKARLSAKVVV